VPQQKTGKEGDWEWITSDLWGSNPVSADTCSNCGKKMGVYWEKKYPTKDFITESVKLKKDTVKYSLPKMDDLPAGLIRVLGRYWSADSTYFVKLKAKWNNDSSAIKIKVKKPVYLDIYKKNTSFQRARDIRNSEINIDSLCILFGGRYGIPPQLIKGQIFTESVKKVFTFTDGKSDSGFAPSYRYEPFTEQYNENLKKEKYNKYYITDSTYTFSDVPTDHQHVMYINYPTSIKTVWDMINEYSKLVNPHPSVNYYGGRNSSTDSVWFGYSVDKDYSTFAKKIRKEKKNWSNAQIYDSTNKKMIEYLKNEWKPKNSIFSKGTINNIAQTRAASSYGLAQFLYGTARDKNYPKDSIPENINSINNLELFYKTQKEYLQGGLSKNVENGNNWAGGYEYSFCRKIYVPKWNSKTTYAQSIIKNSKRFFPK
jgi:hypothetical protein